MLYKVEMVLSENGHTARCYTMAVCDSLQSAALIKMALEKTMPRNKNIESGTNKVTSFNKEFDVSPMFAHEIKKYGAEE